MSRLARPLVAAASLLAAGHASALTIEFDYGYDDGTVRLSDGQKAILASVADEFGARLTDTLELQPDAPAQAVARAGQHQRSVRRRSTARAGRLPVAGVERGGDPRVVSRDRRGGVLRAVSLGEPGLAAGQGTGTGTGRGTG